MSKRDAVDDMTADLKGLLKPDSEHQPWKGIVKSSITGVVAAMYMKIIHKENVLKPMLLFLLYMRSLRYYDVFEAFKLRQLYQNYDTGDFYMRVAVNGEKDYTRVKELAISYPTFFNEEDINGQKKYSWIGNESEKKAEFMKEHGNMLDRIIYKMKTYELWVMKLTIMTIVFRSMSPVKKKIEKLSFLGMELPSMSLKFSR